VATGESRTKELVRRSRDGDTEAFEALYRDHVGPVYALCLRMTGDRERANELTQDVFVTAWRKLSSFRGDAALATWLHAIACNVVRQSRRSETRRQARFAEDDDLDSHAGGAEGVSTEARIDLERALAKLPPRARRALILHDIHGYRCREVAEITGTAVGTIQAHVHRARKLLKEGLGR
jgi:RNA polymerase sigma-70 factor, ECF subfamily